MNIPHASCLGRFAHAAQLGLYRQKLIEEVLDFSIRFVGRVQWISGILPVKSRSLPVESSGQVSCLWMVRSAGRVQALGDSDAGRVQTRRSPSGVTRALVGRRQAAVQP
jgi:hypothetical protein